MEKHSMLPDSTTNERHCTTDIKLTAPVLANRCAYEHKLIDGLYNKVNLILLAVIGLLVICLITVVSVLSCGGTR